MKKNSFTTKQLKVIELLALGELTQKRIAEIVKVKEGTITGWKKNADFMEAVTERCRALLKENLPEVYKALTDKSKKGNDRHIKIYLDHLEKLEEAKSNTTQITFTWKRADPPQD